MIALLMAAQVFAQPTPLVGPGLLARQAEASRFCKSNGMVETSSPVDPTLLFRDDGKTKARKLADLPKPNKEKAVLRSIDGCANPLVVQFNVGP